MKELMLLVMGEMKIVRDRVIFSYGKTLPGPSFAESVLFADALDRFLKEIIGK